MGTKTTVHADPGSNGAAIVVSQFPRHLLNFFFTLICKVHTNRDGISVQIFKNFHELTSCSRSTPKRKHFLSFSTRSSFQKSHGTCISILKRLPLASTPSHPFRTFFCHSLYTLLSNPSLDSTTEPYEPLLNQIVRKTGPLQPLSQFCFFFILLFLRCSLFLSRSFSYQRLFQSSVYTFSLN